MVRAPTLVSVVVVVGAVLGGLGGCKPARPTSCDLTNQACVVRVGSDEGGADLTVDLGTRPLGAGVPIEVRLATAVPPGAQPRFAAPSLTITEATVMMPPVTARFTARPDGSGWVGHYTLPVCAEHRMDWQIDLAFTFDGAVTHQHFTFATFKNPKLVIGTPVVEDIEDVTGSAPADFTLTSTAGAFHLADLRGKLVILAFGYASCPDVCPTTLASLSAAYAALTPVEREQVAVVFVSVDPDRDDPARLTQYAAYFNPAIRGVTGSKDEIAAAAALFRVFYEFHGDAVDHASFSSLVDKDGRLVARIPHGAGVDVVHRAVREHLPGAPPPKNDPATTAPPNPTTNPATNPTTNPTTNPVGGVKP